MLSKQFIQFVNTKFYRNSVIMNHSRTFLNSLKVRMSTKAKVPNYYDTLNVSHNSTQDDIKASYYDLSKKYHPDRNTSADAKRKFQSLSDAYEVLGNFNKRKQYDRDLIARGGAATSTVYTHVKEDPLTGFYKSRKSQYNPTRDSQGGPTKFDFDEWTRAHYGSTLRRSIRDKSNKILRERLRILHEKEMEQNRSSTIVIVTVTALVGLGLMLQSYNLHHDRNLILKNKKSDKR